MDAVKSVGNRNVFCSRAQTHTHARTQANGIYNSIAVCRLLLLLLSHCYGNTFYDFIFCVGFFCSFGFV